MPEYSFRETVAAYRRHIRQLTEQGQKLSGGADTLTLCGLKAAWDLTVPIATAHWDQVDCVVCREKYVALIATEVSQ